MSEACMHKKDKEALVEFTRSFNPEFFITLVFRPDVTRRTAEKSMIGLIDKMNRRFFTRKSKSNLRLLPVLEMGRARYEYTGCDLSNVEANWHLHLVIENPTKRDSHVSEMDVSELKGAIGELWGNTLHGDEVFTTRHYDDDWFKSVYDIEGLTYYLNKEVFTGNELAVCFDHANNTGVKIKKR
ncbi:hypothetical protein [Onishia taeanensis]